MAVNSKIIKPLMFQESSLLCAYHVLDIAWLLPEHIQSTSIPQAALPKVFFGEKDTSLRRA